MIEVPFINYSKKLLPYRKNISESLLRSAQTSEFILKTDVSNFETAIKNKLDIASATTVSSATFALYMSLIALGVTQGDEVITPAFSYISTASVISQIGAIPIFVDVDRDTYMMNLKSIEEKVTNKTKAIIAVHLFSALADMPSLKEYARSRNLALIEDSAVMLGGKINGHWAGTFGDVGVYSFFPAKPLGGIGDGGMIVTNNKELANQFFRLRNHGQDGITRFLHHRLGFNSRMDEVNANFLLHRLNTFERDILRRSEIANYYHNRLKALHPHLTFQKYNPNESSNYAYVICANNRDLLQRHLLLNGIQTKIYYPEALPFQPAFHYLGHKRGEYLNAEYIAAHALALPICETLINKQIEYVIDKIVDFYNEY